MTREPFVLYSSFLAAFLAAGRVLVWETRGFSQLDPKFQIIQLKHQVKPLSKLNSAHRN